MLSKRYKSTEVDRRTNVETNLSDFWVSNIPQYFCFAPKPDERFETSQHWLEDLKYIYTP